LLWRRSLTTRTRAAISATTMSTTTMPTTTTTTTTTTTPRNHTDSSRSFRGLQPAAVAKIRRLVRDLHQLALRQTLQPGTHYAGRIVLRVLRDRDGATAPGRGPESLGTGIDPAGWPTESGATETDRDGDGKVSSAECGVYGLWELERAGGDNGGAPSSRTNSNDGLMRRDATRRVRATRKEGDWKAIVQELWVAKRNQQKEAVAETK